MGSAKRWRLCSRAAEASLHFASGKGRLLTSERGPAHRVATGLLQEHGMTLNWLHWGSGEGEGCCWALIGKDPITPMNGPWVEGQHYFPEGGGFCLFSFAYGQQSATWEVALTGGGSSQYITRTAHEVQGQPKHRDRCDDWSRRLHLPQWKPLHPVSLPLEKFVMVGAYLPCKHARTHYGKSSCPKQRAILQPCSNDRDRLHKPIHSTHTIYVKTGRFAPEAWVAHTGLFRTKISTAKRSG